MANTDNSCSNLKVGDDFFPDFNRIFELQKDIQEKIYHYDFKSMSLDELKDFWFLNKHALEDELSEMFDALGGINDGIGNAVWKPWKEANKKSYGMHISDLSDKDKLELLMEIVDAFHFMINFAVSCGFTGSQIANAYISKNKENIRRQNEGY